ncbi:hypothetical protein C8F01DRAFT_78071 [Mycena amicta]|nr:hypothetical protein C8F01DRAFT_78071 [Mycena amicta]
MSTRRRSFHLSPHPTPALPSRINATALTANLLALSQQASAFAYALVTACAPGVRAPKPPTSPAIEHEHVQQDRNLGITRVNRRNSVVQEDSCVPEPTTASIVPDDPEVVRSEIQPTTAIGLGIFVPSESANQLRLLDARRSPPASASELRSDIVRRVKVFTTARMSRVPEASPSPTITTPTRHSPLVSSDILDDPFSSPTQYTPCLPSRNPATLQVLALMRTHFFSIRQTQNSPTPVARPGVRRRPALRQQTVFFDQPDSPIKTPPKFWKPHPAGKRSCAIPIKAAKEHKENFAV